MLPSNFSLRTDLLTRKYLIKISSSFYLYRLLTLQSGKCSLLSAYRTIPSIERDLHNAERFIAKLYSELSTYLIILRFNILRKTLLLSDFNLSTSSCRILILSLSLIK